jgi:hypothetical protein
MIKKISIWAGIVFLIFFISYNPNEAAAVFKSLGGGIKDIATGFADFFTALVA